MNIRFIVGACLYSVVLRRTIASTTTAASAVMADAESTGNESYVAGTHSTAFVTVPNMDVAKTLARGAVENKLAACVNIIPSITSVYEWEGKINEDSELLLMIKTRTSKVDELSKFVRENHPYEVCEVISVPIENGNPPYLKWLGDVVPK